MSRFDPLGLLQMTQECVWPSGDYKPICLLALDYQKMALNFGLVFEEGCDDLDEYFSSFFVDSDIGPVLLLQYKNAPVPGVGIYVDSGVDTSRAISVVIERFCLSNSDLKWKRDVD